MELLSSGPMIFIPHGAPMHPTSRDCVYCEVARLTAECNQLATERNHFAGECDRAWALFLKENKAAIRMNLQVVDLRDALERIASIEAIDQYGTNASLIARETLAEYEQKLSAIRAADSAKGGDV